MGKRIFSILIVVAMCLTLLPTWAWAEEADTETEPESTVEITSEWFDLGDITTSVEPSRLFSTFGLLSSATGTVELAAGTHANWIDRVDLNDCQAAKDFYDILVKGSDGDGTNDVLIDDRYFTKDIENGTIQLNYSNGTADTFNAILVTTIERDSAMEDTEKDYIRSCITAAWNAFDRDHPEVFWLSGSSNVNIVTSTKTTTNNGVSTTTYTYKYYFILKSFNEDGNVDIRSEEYQSAQAIKAGITTRDNRVQAILNDLPEGATTYDTILYFNNWLTEHNAYNSAVAKGEKDNASRSAWECISALTGKTGTGGPVCEGYARAFKVLCDKVGIPCVLVDGQAASQPGGTPEAHMWNNVQVGETWYAVDVTWNDPTSSTVDSTVAVSGLENHNWLLVGSETTIGQITFETSHAIANKVSTNGIAFTNGPTLNETSYVDPAAPATIELSYTPTATASSTVNGVSVPAFSIPTITSLDVPTSKEITLTATLKDANNTELTGQTVQWSLSKTYDGITLTTDGNTATLTITNSALSDRDNDSGPYITVTASCSTTKAEQKFLIYVPKRTAAFVQILKENDVVTSDTLAAGDSTTYTAKVYDQYGMEMSDQTVAWSVSENSLATVSNGTVTVNGSAADNGNFTVTATAGTTATASVSVSIASSNSHSLTHYPAKAATCTEPGNIEYWYCETCQKYFSDANETKEITQGTVIPALGHDWGRWTVTKEATENEDGEQTRTCSRCNATETKEIKALTITSGTAVTYGTTLELTTSGGSGSGAVTFTVADGTGAATVSGSTLTPTKVGNVIVTATKAADETSVATTATMTITINPATLTPSITGGTTKTYDGTTNAPGGLSIQLAGVVNGDTVTATAASYTYNSANVSEANTITATGITLSGDKAANYTLSSNTVTTAGKIEKSTPTVTFNDYPTTVTYSGAALADPTADQMSITGAAYDDVQFTWSASAGSSLTDGKPVNAGSYTLTATIDETANTNKAEVSTAVTISPKEVATPTIELSPDSYEYDGTAKVPTVTVKDGDTVIPASEYSVTYSDNTNVGKATVTIKDAEGGNYTVNGTATFEITKPSLAGADVSVSGSYTYNGQAQVPTSDQVTVKLNDVTVPAGEYTVSVENNTDAGTATVTVTAATNGNYSGSATGHFTIDKASLTITAKAQTITYGESIATGTNQVTCSPVGGDTLASITLTPSTTAVTNNGTITPSAAVIMSGETDVTDNYAITYESGNLTIQKMTTSVSFVNTTASYTYTGAALTNPTESKLTITGAQYSDVTFTWYKDSVAAGNKLSSAPTDAGTYYVVASIAATDNTTAASAQQKVTITPCPITVTPVAGQSKTYGAADPTLTYTVNGKPEAGAALTGELSRVTGENVGTYAITQGTLIDDNNPNYAITFTGDVTFEIKAAEIKNAEVTVSGTYTYNGSAQTPAVTVKLGGTDLTAGTDYTVSYSNSNGGAGNVTNAGTVTVTVTGTGNYQGTNNATFTIQPKEITAAITGTDFGKTYDGTTNVLNSLSITLDGVVNDDDVTATATSYAYDSADAGDRTITATGITLSGGKAANYTLSNTTATVAGSITAKDISSATVTLGGALTFDGSAQTPSITSVTVDGLPVTYNVAGNTGTDAGSYELTITGNGNFTGSVTKAWSIAKAKAPTVESQEEQHLRTSAATNSIDLGALLPANRRTTTYNVANENYSGLENVTVDTDGKLTYTTKVMSSETTDTITVTAAMANYETVTITVTVKLVGKTPVTITGVTAQDGTYNGSAQTGYTGTPDSDYKGNYTVTYAGRNDTVYDDSATAPTAAGDYTVTIAVPDSNAQYTGSVSLDFTIAKKSITITGVQATARDYEADNTTVALAGGTLDGVVNGDDVSFTLGTGTIAKPDAGTGKAVTVTGSTLTGSTAGNYTLTEPTGVTVTINKINPTYTAPSNVTAVFGQTLADVAIGTPGTDGSWAWKTPTDLVGNVGTNNHDMVFTPADSTNYNTLTLSVPVTVSKAAAPTLADQTVSLKYNAAGEQTVSLSGLMPDNAGALSYAAGTETDNDGIIGSWSVSGDTLTYTLASGLDSTKAGKTATLPVTISSANYEDATVNVVVTLTGLQAQAALSITSGTAVTYGSTLALTTSGGSGSGAVTFTVTNGTGEATVSGSTLTPKKAGSVTVTATKAADGTYAEATATLTITIKPASIANAEVTLNPTAAAGSVKGDEPRSTKVESVKLNGSTLTAGKDYTVSIPTEMKKAGNYTVTVTGTGNYTGTATATFTINPVTEAPALPPELTETDDNKFKVEVETGLSEVPKAFESNTELNTPEKIETKLTTEITTVNTAISQTNVAVYDVTLMVSTNGGSTWTKATKENFPADGKLTVTLPYPEGTDSSYTFTVVHMFTTNDFGKTLGETETPAVTNTANGIQFQVTGLSPISVGWTAPKSNHNGGQGSYIPTTVTYPVTADTVSNGTVKMDISRAAKGTTVTITATPDDNYELSNLEVRDANGSRVSLTQIGDDKFTFTMPGSSVTVSASFAQVQPEPAVNPFVDVAENHYFYNAVLWAVENGITNGYGSATTFAPDVTCSRAEAVTFLWRAAGEPDPVTTENPFTDVSESAYYYEAVLWAVENEITNGYGSATTFAPDVKCSRAEIVTFLYRAVGSPVTASGNGFDDVSSSAWYANAVTWAVKYGITNGYGNNALFAPDKKCSRAEIVTFLYRTYAN